MNNYNDMIGKSVYVDGGKYEILVYINGGGYADEHIDLYVGRATDGHHDLIVSDNASMWAVGDEDDAERNREHWELITERVGDIYFGSIRAIDADLADWLEDRKAEADEAKSAMTYEERYDVHLIKAGDQFWHKGIVAASHQLMGNFRTLDEVREAFREWAEETYDECLRDGDFAEALGEGSIDDDVAVAAADEKVDKLREEFSASAANTLSLEWRLDSKYLRVCKVREWSNGEEEVVEFL
jgi:hypothetical protein